MRCRTCLRRAQKAQGHGESWRGTLLRLHSRRSSRWLAFPSVLELACLLPIEVVSDVAGIGQLAWQAAQARDLPLLVNLTMVVTFVTVCATLISDAAQRGFRRSAA